MYCELESFQPHPALSDEINLNIGLSEAQGGVWMDDLPVGALVEMKTEHRSYLLENLGEGRMRIQGHERYCPDPVVVDVYGSTWGSTVLKVRFIGQGMHLEFRHPELGVIRTSPIREVRQLERQPRAA